MLNATRSPRPPGEIRPALTDAALPQLQHEVVGLRTPDLMRTTRGAVALPPGEERSDPFAERGSQRAGARASRASSSGMRKYAEVLYVGDLARCCSLVSIGSRWSITGTRGHRTGTPQRILSASRYSASTWRAPRLCGCERPDIAPLPVLARPRVVVGDAEQYRPCRMRAIVVPQRATAVVAPPAAPASVGPSGAAGVRSF